MAETGPLAHSPTLVAPASDAGAGRDDDVLAPGAVAGEYVVDRFLGAGAMGDVYAGHHPVIGKKVAIKVLKHAAASSPDAAERFIREARAVNQVEHPNVVDVFAFGRLASGDGRLYLVMDLVEGQSLRKALVAGPLEIATALHVLGEIADALDAAHARGVVHRDLKPDNVMLGSQTPPKVSVLDFGLAKLVAVTDAPLAAGAPLTSKGTWLGTPGYMAPEQWSADGAGPASDRYSLGVMAFELLSGQLPFQAGSLPQMMEQHFRTPVPALSTRGAAVARDAFDPVLARAMAKDPDARFGSAREMVDALRAAAGTPGRRLGRTPRRQWLPIVAGAGVLGVAAFAYRVVSAPATPRDAAPGVSAATRPEPGARHVELRSVPDHAEVWRGGAQVGTTPVTLDAPADRDVVVDVRKPGYAPAHVVHRAGAAGSPPIVELASIDGFEGVWALPDGELRAFQRVGDRVDVFKLASVTGERRFHRHFDFAAAAEGVAFATVEDIVDPRAPDDPGCHIPHRVEYQYDPRTDALVAHPEHVDTDFRDGHCVTLARSAGAPQPLVRVDHATTDVRGTDAPLGVPEKVQRLPGKVSSAKAPPTKAPPAKKSAAKPTSAAAINDSMDNVFDRGQKDANQPANAVSNAAPGPRGDSQVAPQGPQTTAPAQNAAQAPPQQAQPPQPVTQSRKK